MQAYPRSEMSSRVFLRTINSLISKRYQEGQTNLAEMVCLECKPYNEEANRCLRCRRTEFLIIIICCKTKVCLLCFQGYC